MMHRALLLCALFALLVPRQLSALTGEDLVHQWNVVVLEAIMEDGFAPPVAARIHAYVNLAGYEAGRHADPSYKCMAGQLNQFTDCPQPDAGKTYDWRVAAVAAYQVACSKTLYRIYYSDSLAKLQFAELQKEVNGEVFTRSKEYGVSVGKAILAYAKADGYLKTQGLPDYEWPKCDSCWVPTPPNFGKPLLPYMGTVRTIALKDAHQIPCAGPLPYSTDKNSEFYKQAYEIYQIHKKLVGEERNIANFWNDNPIMTMYQGHFIYNTRQISPGGHWMNIAMQIMRTEKTDWVKSMAIYTHVGSALYDAFISVWAQKYKHNLIRPVTYIQQHIEKNWEPMLQTPPFPEHSGGHSTITAAASEVLTHWFGDNYSYTDSTEIQFGYGMRSFKSFRQAAQEASISRMYGGIHYRRGCDAGNEHGTKIGQYIVATLRFKD
jgi:hypothetical protein